MYVVWRKRPVKGRGGAPFITLNPDWYGVHTSWMPLECRHRGEGRDALRALVIHAERVDGKPRQRIIEQFPTIRTCCIADPFNRAAWWCHARWLIGTWSESLSDTPEFLHFARDKSDIFAKLRAVVPRPTAKGQAMFDAHRAETDRAWHVRDKAEKDRQWARYEEQEREKKARDQRERDERNRRAWDEFRSTFGPGSGFSAGAGAAEDCYRVLGVKPTATVDEIKAAYRDLAKRHHPDKGGDAAEFNRVKVASEQALRRATKAAG